MVECSVQFKDDTSKIYRPTVHEISLVLGSNGFVSAIDYLQTELGANKIERINVLNTFYFNTKEDYIKYLKSLE